MGLRRCEAIRVFPGSFRPPTMPSADSCPITDRVTPAGAVGDLDERPRVRRSRSLVPQRRRATGRQGVCSAGHPFRHVIPKFPNRNLLALSGRSPRIRTWTFAAQPRHLPCPRTHGLRSCCACSPKDQAFYGVSVRRLAALPPASSGPLLAETPLPSASGCTTRVLPQGTFTPSIPRPCRAYTKVCTGLAISFGAPLRGL